MPKPKDEVTDIRLLGAKPPIIPALAPAIATVSQKALDAFEKCLCGEAFLVFDASVNRVAGGTGAARLASLAPGLRGQLQKRLNSGFLRDLRDAEMMGRNPAPLTSSVEKLVAWLMSIVDVECPKNTIRCARGSAVEDVALELTVGGKLDGRQFTVVLHITVHVWARWLYEELFSGFVRALPSDPLDRAPLTVLSVLPPSTGSRFDCPECTDFELSALSPQQLTSAADHGVHAQETISSAVSSSIADQIVWCVGVASEGVDPRSFWGQAMGYSLRKSIGFRAD